jgi:hypothetical protein
MLDQELVTQNAAKSSTDASGGRLLPAKLMLFVSSLALDPLLGSPFERRMSSELSFLTLEARILSTEAWILSTEALYGSTEGLAVTL